MSNKFHNKPPETNNFEFTSNSSRTNISNSISPWMDSSSHKFVTISANKKILSPMTQKRDIDYSNKPSLLNGNLVSKNVISLIKLEPQNNNNNTKIIDTSHIVDDKSSDDMSIHNQIKDNFHYPKNYQPCIPKNQNFNNYELSGQFQNTHDEFSPQIRVKDGKMKKAILISAGLNPDFPKTGYNNGNNFGFAFYPTHNLKKHRMSALFANSIGSTCNSPNFPQTKPQKIQLSPTFNINVKTLQKNQPHSEYKILDEKNLRKKLQQQRASLATSQQNLKTLERIPDEFRSLNYQKRTTTASPTMLRHFNSTMNPSLGSKNLMGISLIDEEPIKSFNKKVPGKFAVLSDLMPTSNMMKFDGDLNSMPKTYCGNVIRKGIQFNSSGFEKLKNSEVIQRKNNSSDKFSFSKVEKFENDEQNKQQKNKSADKFSFSKLEKLKNDDQCKNNNVNYDSVNSIKYNEMKFDAVIRKPYLHSTLISSPIINTNLQIMKKISPVDFLEHQILISKSRAQKQKEDLKGNLSRNMNNSNDFEPW